MLVLASVTACSDAVAEKVASVPVPAGAVLVEEEHSFHGERGAQATRAYSLPSRVAESCPTAVGRLLDAGYLLKEASATRTRIRDAAGWCATTIAAERAAYGANSLVDVGGAAYEAGPDEETAPVLFSFVLLPPRPTDPYPAGTLLRLQAP